MRPTIADRLRDIAAELRTRIAEGDFDECDPSTQHDMADLPDALEQLAKEAER